MGAVPKRRISKGRKRRRRGHHSLKQKNLVKCPSCGKMKKQHQVCPNCGKYKDEEIINVS